MLSADLTGKLRTCGGCGKLEAKRGSFSKCSGCYEELYCSREVRLVLCIYIISIREQILISFITHASIARSVKFAIGKKTTKRSARKRISEVKLSSVD